MTRRTAVTMARAVAIVLTMWGTAIPARAASGFEAEPVLTAKDLAVPELLQGPHFTVSPKVPVKGFLERFTIQSDYGTFEAHGLHMLAIRVNEVGAIGKLDDLSKTKEFAEAAGRAVARPVTSTVNMLVHPVETVTGFPDGVGRLFDRIKLGSEKVYQAATAPGASGGERTTAAAKRVGDSAAWVAFSGRFIIQTAMSVAVPYSMAMSAATITNSSIYDTPPGDLVNNATAVFASGAQTQDETRFVAGAVNILARYHEGVASLTQVSAPGPILGRTVAGALVVPMPVDYIAWTERVSRFPQREDIKGAPEHVGFISGRLSPLAQKNFTVQGWKMLESFTIAAER